MGIRNRRLGSAVSVVACLLAFGCSAAGQSGHPRVAPPPRALGLCPLPGRNRPQVVFCDFLGEPAEPGIPNRIVVRENPASSTSPLSQLYFISGWPASPKVELVHSESIPFGGLLFGAENLVLTEWVAGDRPVVEAFRLVKGGAEMVFEGGARGGFEFWHDIILRSNAAIGPDGSYHATTTQLWQWNGKQYKLSATVPYGQRLEALSKLEHEAPAGGAGKVGKK